MQQERRHKDRRNDPKRVRIVLTCQMIASGSINRIVVSNLSTDGIGGRSMLPLAPGDDIRVYLPGIGDVEAEIRWSAGTRFGAKLGEHIAPNNVTLPNANLRVERPPLSAPNTVGWTVRRVADRG